MTHEQQLRDKNQHLIDRMLLVLALINIVSCIGGAWGIAVSGAELFGRDILANTVFSQRYDLAAGLLAFVGLTQLLAVVLYLIKSRWTLAAHAVAGLTMMTFLFGEVMVLEDFFFLQPVFYAVGGFQVVLVLIRLQVVKKTAHHVRTSET